MQTRGSPSRKPHIDQMSAPVELATHTPCPAANATTQTNETRRYMKASRLRQTYLRHGGSQTSDTPVHGDAEFAPDLNKTMGHERHEDGFDL